MSSRAGNGEQRRLKALLDRIEAADAVLPAPLAAEHAERLLAGGPVPPAMHVELPVPPGLEAPERFPGGYRAERRRDPAGHSDVCILGPDGAPLLATALDAGGRVRAVIRALGLRDVAFEWGTWYISLLTWASALGHETLRVRVLESHANLVAVLGMCAGSRIVGKAPAPAGRVASAG